MGFARDKWALAIVMTVAASAATAADLTATVVDAMGRPVEHAVVMLQPETNVGTGDWQAPPAVMMQKGMLFTPFVLPVRVGTTVSFPNQDDVRHHVYSFSSAKRFELRLYGRDETKKVTFDVPGLVPLGCNIHDNMLSYIYVTAHPVYAVTDNKGQARLRGLPSGAYATFVWHPDVTGDRTEQPGPALNLPPTGAALTLRADLRATRSTQAPPREGANY